MECNKEEAVRAMQLSETKMQNKDYKGAMKMAQKAQRLFPDLENISQLLTVCEVHCRAENKLGGSEMDWYRILQIQPFDSDDNISKQYRKLALLLHPDKNNFAGSEAAFKWIVEAKSVLLDKQKRTIYDIKYRTLVRPGAPRTTAGAPRTTAAATNSQKNPVSQGDPNTFWTQCYNCLSKYQYYRELLNRLLRCHNCRKAFEAHELREGVHPKSFRNHFPNHKEPPSQGPSNFASQSNGGTEKGNFTRFQNGDAAFKPASKVGNHADLSGACEAEKKDNRHEVELGKQGVETSKSSPVKSKDARTSSNIRKTREKTTSELGEGLKTGNNATADTEDAVKEKVEHSAGHHRRRSPRNKHNLSSLLNDKDDDDDFVSPPLKRLRKGQLFGATEKKGNDAAVDGNKRDTIEIASFPVEENLPNKKSKTEEFELKVKGAAMSDHDQSNPKADVRTVANVDAASTPDIIELPDPQFHTFAPADSLPSLVKVNQIWALYEPGDDMPRWYAFIKKVLTPGFKLEISWLEPNPYDQGEIDWCVKGLPVACGKFKFGGTDEIKGHLAFSHQMYYTRGRGRNSILVYPRKGETWAIYQNWDIRWSSEPEKHMPYKYEFVEILTDFVEADGIGVRYLGKLKGFVSLFEQTDQHGVVMFQVLPHELYIFSHRIPSFKMTGCEGHGVPPGSFELDPASLPTSIFNCDLGDVEMDDRSKKTETDGPSCEKVGSVTACTGIKQEKKLSEGETSMTRSPRKSVNTEFVNRMKGKSMTNLSHGNLTQLKDSAIPCQADKTNNTLKKHQNNDSDKATFSLRRSPRELNKNSTTSNGAMKYPDSAEDGNHVGFPQANTTSSQYSNRIQSTPKDQDSPNHMKDPVPPPSSSFPPCRLSPGIFYEFKGLKSQDKFSLGQIWALYSDGYGMPNTYAQVKRIEARPKFQVHMAVLEPCSELKHLSGPVSCGTFLLKDCPTKVFPLSAFCHCLSTGTALCKKVLEIRPKKGEIWALYKNHNPEPAKGECELVEVLEDDGRCTKVGVLVKVKGFKSIFKSPRIQRSQTGIVDVLQAEFHRFSHQIPAFHHRGEIDRRVAGCWELDPLSIPGTVIHLD